MREEKDLERLFRERFKDFEATPERDLWPGIKDRLDGSASRRVLPMYWKRLAALAAMFAIAFFGAQTFLNTPEQEIKQSDSVTEQSETDGNIPATKMNAGSNAAKEYLNGNMSQDSKNDNSLSGITESLPDEVESGSQDSNAPSSNNPYRESSQPFPHGYTSTTYLPSNNLTLRVWLPQADPIVLASASTETRSDEAFFAELTEEEDEDRATGASDRWTVNPAVAPVYYGTLNNDSPLEPSLNGHSKSGETHVSYGVNFAYRLSSKLSLRTGVNRVTMGYTTNNVSFSPSASTAEMAGNINYTNSNLNIILNDLGRRPQNAFLPDVPKARLVYNGDMAQRMGYLEVPLELKYRMAGKRLGIHLIGGMSSLFLVDNSIMLQSESLNTELGEATNLNSLNFSTNLGVGLDYRFTNDLLFNLEPMFKYQWNTFSGNDGGFSPYLLGVYTGFSFRF